MDWRQHLAFVVLAGVGCAMAPAEETSGAEGALEYDEGWDAWEEDWAAHDACMEEVGDPDYCAAVYPPPSGRPDLDELRKCIEEVGDEAYCQAVYPPAGPCPETPEDGDADCIPNDQDPTPG